MSFMPPMTHSSPTSQSPRNLAPVGESRGRGKHKCYWDVNETQLLIDVLQDLACDPAWKTDGGFRSNYLGEVHRRILGKIPNFTKQVSPHLESKVKWLKTKFHTINDMLKQSGCQWNDVEKKIACEKHWYESYCQNHKEAKGLWDFKFPFFNQLELVYGKDRATGATVEGYGDAIHNMEYEQNIESGGQNLGDYYVSLSDEEENDMHNMSQSTPMTSHVNNARTTKKQKTTYVGDKAAKRRKTSLSQDMEAQFEQINHSFKMFVQGFNANFATMANAVANAMTNDDNRQKIASEKTKDLLHELMKLNIPSGDVLRVADIFAANKEKIDIFLNLHEQLRVPYVQKLLGLSSGY